MATVIIDSSGFPQADAYYRLVPWQVVGPSPRDLPITQRILQQGMTLRSMLETLRTLPPGSEAVLVAHGVAGGLSLPLASGVRTEASLSATDALLSSMATEQHSAQVLDIPVRTLRELRELAAAVRAQRLAQIDIRACNLGASPLALESLKRLLGPQRIGAPRILNAYGFLQPGNVVSDATAWSRWMAVRPTAREYDYGQEGKVAVFAPPQPHRGSLQTVVSSPTVMVRWVQDRLARGQALGQGAHNWWARDVPYHAAYHWQRDFPLIWPAAVDYVGQIVYV